MIRSSSFFFGRILRLLLYILEHIIQRRPVMLVSHPLKKKAYKYKEQDIINELFLFDFFFQFDSVIFQAIHIQI